MRSKARIFGPGFPSTGTAAGVDFSEFGLRVETTEPNDGTPRWNAIELAKSGWDGSQLRLEWKGSAGAYALMIGDSEAVAAIREFADGKSKFAASGADPVTHRLSMALIAITLILPLLLIGGMVAFVVALASVQFLIRMVQKKGFAVFGWYRIVLGTTILALLYTQYLH